MQAEELLGEKGLPFTCFRPQYIYGPKQGKSYLAPFFDRACRELPPRPAPAARSPQPAARSLTPDQYGSPSDGHPQPAACSPQSEKLLAEK